jgi:hypothetical protein
VDGDDQADVSIDGIGAASSGRYENVPGFESPVVSRNST